MNFQQACETISNGTFTPDERGGWNNPAALCIATKLYKHQSSNLASYDATVTKIEVLDTEVRVFMESESYIAPKLGSTSWEYDRHTAQVGKEYLKFSREGKRI